MYLMCSWWLGSYWGCHCPSQSLGRAGLYPQSSTSLWLCSSRWLPEPLQLAAAPLPTENKSINSFKSTNHNTRFSIILGVNERCILCALTCSYCPCVTFGAIAGTVGRVNVAVVSCWRSQAVHLSIQGCEGVVVSPQRKTKQLLHKKDIAVGPHHGGPLKLYRWTWNSFWKCDLRCSRHCGEVKEGIHWDSSEEFLCIHLVI